MLIRDTFRYALCDIFFRTFCRAFFRAPRTIFRLMLVGVLALIVTGCSSFSLESGVPQSKPAARKLPPNQYEVFGKVYEILPDNLGYLEIGVSSWYGKKFHGRLTANGETYDMFEMTAAHKALPLPTVVKVTNLDNGQSIVVRVNDRGPFHDDRLIDLSYAAAKALGFADKGVAPVVVEAVDEINHPELGAIEPHEAFTYLQVGAFRVNASAQRKLALVRAALPPETPTRILVSETEVGDLLHKVWVGPLQNERLEAETIAQLLAANLGQPLRVSVE